MAELFPPMRAARGPSRAAAGVIARNWARLTQVELARRAAPVERRRGAGWPEAVGTALGLHGACVGAFARAVPFPVASIDATRVSQKD